MRERILIYLKAILIVIYRRVFLWAGVLLALAAGSFLFTGKLSLISLGERVIWAGIISMLVGGVLVMGQTMGGREYGVPGMFVRTAHAQALIDWNIEVRQSVEKKMDFTIQIFLAGLLVFGIGALISVLAS